MPVTGVLLKLDCRAERVTNDNLKIFNWLKCFCGPLFYKNITIVFSQWDRVPEREDHVAERSREAKNTILRRYSDAPNGQLQVGMDMVDNHDNWRLTEVAKALFASNPSHTRLVIDQDRGLVVSIDGQPQRLSLTHTSSSGSQTVDPQPVGPPPAPASESSRQPMSWAESMRKWPEVAKAVADFFKEARSTDGAPFRWRIADAWGKLRAWWRGGSS
ncbi:hypothetical protein SPBR_07830 [Sporothrix brasiliensis 5110]|uniref:Uncharacterized protein n=1 Tax=Sporothrix brasiliensis 5110 TaxID=1398154 RepID=A0A0C2FC84_9PEZI|nr:uncharacterized protein SPBR_07830 [Sporothrix brasiliensis 5110]KIH88723.1 hypothetical protein SPBR_07830 [Sporothrix brasiliensis 5110]